MAQPFLQKVPSQPPKVMTLTLNSYSGGLDNIASQTTVRNECATNVLNMVYLEDGLIQKRFGSSVYKEQIYGQDIVFFDTFSPYGDVEQMIVATIDKVYANGVKIADVAGEISGVAINGAYHFADGEHLRTYEKVSGVWKCYKIITPTNLDSTLSIAGVKGKNTITVPDGTKFAKDRYIQIGETKIAKAEGQNDLIPAQTARVYSVSGNVVTLGEDIEVSYLKTDLSTGEPSTVIKTEFRATNLNYDYIAGTKVIIFASAEKYKYVGEWKTNETNMTKWYEPCAHELADPFKGVNLLPIKPSYVAYNKNRLILAGVEGDEHTLYISHTNNPYYCPVGLGLSLPANGDKINGIASFHDSLVVSRHNDMHVVYGTTNKEGYGELFRLNKITTHTGCANGKTMQVVHNYLFYLGSDGVAYRMVTTNTDIRMLTTAVLSQRIDFFKSPFDLSLEDVENSCSTFTNENYYLSIKNYVFCYSYRFMAWTVLDRLDATYMRTIGGEVVWSKGNRLMRFDNTTFLDEGIAYNCFWESKLFDLDYPTIYKYFKYISLVFDVYEEYDSQVDLVFEIDYEDVNVKHTFRNQIARWGVALWGDRFISRNINKSNPVYVGRRGRMVKVKIRNGYKVEAHVNTVADLSTVPNIHPNMCVYVKDVQKHYWFYYEEERFQLEWRELSIKEINQPIKLYNIEVEYSLRGRR